MAVPNDNFGLVDVITEIDKYGEIVLKFDGEGGRLTAAFNAASDTGFASGTPPATTGLSEFAGYEQPNPEPPPPPPTVYTFELGYHPSISSDACDNFVFNSFTTVYSYNSNFYDLDAVLYATTPPNENQKAAAGYYTSDFGWRYWDGTSFTNTGTCDSGGDPFGGGGGLGG